MTQNPTPEPNPGPHVGSEGPAYQPAPQAPQTPENAYGGPVYARAPGYPEAPSQTDLNWAAASHWGAVVAAWFAMGFLAPLFIMLTVGNQSPFVRRHAVESLNFQISLLIYSAVAVFFSIITIGLGLIIVIPLALVALVWVVVVVVQASVKATNGEDYRYPLTIRLVS